VIIKKYENLWDDLHKTAKNVKLKTPPRMNYLVPHYFEEFANYATGVVSKKTKIKMTDLGVDLYRDQEILGFLIASTNFLFKPEIIFSIMAKLLSKGDVFINELTNKKGDEREVQIQHIMWLIKYGYLTISN
jgi:hypothetical protein